MATRGELRRRVGSNLGGLYPLRPTIATDTTLKYRADDVQEGDVVYYRDTAREVLDASYQGSEFFLTVRSPFPSFSAGEEAEVWTGNRWHPEEVNNFINQAISDTVARVYQAVDPIYECVTPRNRRFVLADDLAMVSDVYWRCGFIYKNIYSYDNWKASVASEEVVTAVQDFEDYQYPPAWRLEITGEAGAHTATVSFSQTDLSGMTHFEGWFKTRNVSALSITLKSGADNKGAARNIPIPTDGDWQYVQVPITGPEQLRQVNNIVLNITTTANPAYVWTNTLYGVDHDSVDWQLMDRARWRIERETRNLAIVPRQSMLPLRSGFTSGEGLPIEDVVWIQAGRDPVDLEQDSDETIADSWFIVCAATELAFGPLSGGAQVNPDRYREQVRLWAARRDQASRSNFPPQMNARRIR